VPHQVNVVVVQNGDSFVILVSLPKWMTARSAFGSIRVIKSYLKEKTKIILLGYFSELFDVRKIHTEKQVNENLCAEVDDYAKVCCY